MAFKRSKDEGWIRTVRRKSSFSSILRSGVAILSATIGLAVTAFGAGAETFPNRPIVWVQGFAGGGVSDTGARFIAKVLGAKLGKTVIIENKPGAGGVVAAESIVAAKPDGYRLFSASSGLLTALPLMNRNLSFDPLKSFTIVHGYRSSPLILVVPASSPYRSIKELVGHARQNPMRVNYGSVGPGSSAHLVTEMFAEQAGVQFSHVPYKGSIQAVTDLVAGRIDLMFDYSQLVKPLIEAGKLRALAQSGLTRLAIHPDVPTLVELGYPEAHITTWGAIVGPAGMPQPIVDKLSQAFVDAMKDPEVVKFHDQQGVSVMIDDDAEKIRELVISETAKMKRVIERTGVTIE